MKFKQVGRLCDAGFTRMHFGRAQFLAVKGAEPGRKILLQRFRAVRRDQAGRVQRATDSVRRESSGDSERLPAAFKWWRLCYGKDGTVSLF